MECSDAEWRPYAEICGKVITIHYVVHLVILNPLSKFKKSFPRPRESKRKPGGMKPLECLSYLHQEYIRPICEQSGLPGLCYTAGPVVDVCTGAAPPHSTGVLAAVCYPESGSTDIEALCKCGTCGEEYDINDVILQTCELDTSGTLSSKFL